MVLSVWGISLVLQALASSRVLWVLGCSSALPEPRVWRAFLMSIHWTPGFVREGVLGEKIPQEETSLRSSEARR